MCMVINQFLSLSNLCDMPRFHCATCSGLPVRLAPFLLCDLLRIMHWTLYYQSCEMKASPLVTAWLKFKGFDRRLFLNKFALEYPKSNLARAIYQRSEAKIKHFTTEKG